MSAPEPRQLFSLSLTLLLFLPALPARAAGGDFELHLEQALTLQGADLPFGDRAADEGMELRTGEGVAAPDADLAAAGRATAGRESLRETSSARLLKEAAKTDLAQQANRGGTGRWLKKHWYVPVIVAVAAGLALADDGSDGPEDEED